MIGNSSSGIVESAPFHIPVINIGDRQEGREKPENVITVDYNKNDIIDAINKTLLDKDFIKKVKRSKNIYKGNNSTEKIIDVLIKYPLKKETFQKKITY